MKTNDLPLLPQDRGPEAPPRPVRDGLPRRPRYLSSDDGARTYQRLPPGNKRFQRYQFLGVCVFWASIGTILWAFLIPLVGRVVEAVR